MKDKAEVYGLTRASETSLVCQNKLISAEEIRMCFRDGQNVNVCALESPSVLQNTKGRVFTKACYYAWRGEQPSGIFL